MLTDYNSIDIVAQMPAERPIGYEPCKDPEISNIWVAWFLAQLEGNLYLFGGCIHASNGWCLKLRRSCTMGERVMELSQAYDVNADRSQLSSSKVSERYSNGGYAWVQMAIRQGLKEKSK